MEIIKVPLLPIPLLTALLGKEPNSLPFKGRARVGMGLRLYSAIYNDFNNFRPSKF
jgi:hypothetical protein